MTKYALLKERLLRENLLAATDLVEPEPIALDAAALTHTREYLAKLAAGSLSPAELRRLGLPWSEALWRRSRLAAGGTLLAARCALDDGLAANLAGGTHHAFADRGEGFCVLNDVGIAIAQLRAEGRIERAAVIDLDVHQGNGTASIFSGDVSVVTFSMHGENNYPATKVRSTYDIGLPDALGDAGYLASLDDHLPAALEAARADIAFYIGGVDVAAGDRYGKLALTDAGIAERERRVVQALRGRSIPMVIVLGGGYATTPERTADLHRHVFRAAIEYERSAGARLDLL